MASRDWISGATKHKGALHKALGIPAGTKIGSKELNKAFKSKNQKVRKEVRLAKTLKSFSK